MVVLRPVKRKPCACGSWLSHWEKFTGQTMLFCPVIGCLNQNLIGAHVHKASPLSSRYYILPLCKYHAAWSRRELLEVFGGAPLARAEIELTCGQKPRKNKKPR